MKHINDTAWCTSPLFRHIPNLVHAFSTRHLGDMREESNRDMFFQKLRLQPIYAFPKQIHGNSIAIVHDTQSGMVNDVDGLCTVNRGYLVVRTADCAPILAVDPGAKVIGVAHAGWKGTKQNIVSALIKTMCSLGAKKESLLVYIGPCIKKCCYHISYDRAVQFKPYTEAVFHDQTDVWRLDIGTVNKVQLLREGIRAKQIDISPYCTSCHNDAFFSYRKDTKTTFGEMIGVIGFTH